jgi:prepilin-type N-terminal cleavage/methylation domain-containing protein
MTSQTMRIQAKMRRGITLLEVLVAAVLLSIGLLGGLEVIAGTAAAARRSEDHARTLLAARTKMEDLMSTPTLSLGEDRREWSDSTSEYDLITNIASNESFPSLVTINVAAVNKNTGTEVILSALRRQDLTDPAETSEDGTTTDPAAGGTGGTL